MSASKFVFLRMTRALLAFAVAVGISGCGSDDEDAFSPCDECGPGTVCVQLLGGACDELYLMCKPAVPGCEQPECTPACDQAYCAPEAGAMCNYEPCPADVPGALHCYGP